MRPYLSTLAVCVLVLAGGSTLLALAAPSAAPQIPPDWITINAGGVFTLKAPPGAVFVQEQYTLNNARGGVRGPGFELHYVYALETDNLSCAKESTTYAAEMIEIDSRPATLMTATDLPKSCADTDYSNFVGLFDPIATPSYTRPRFYTLTIWGSAAQPQYMPTLKLMYQTIHFTQ